MPLRQQYTVYRKGQLAKAPPRPICQHGCQQCLAHHCKTNTTLQLLEAWTDYKLPGNHHCTPAQSFPRVQHKWVRLQVRTEQLHVHKTSANNVFQQFANYTWSDQSSIPWKVSIWCRNKLSQFLFTHITICQQNHHLLQAQSRHKLNWNKQTNKQALRRKTFKVHHQQILSY